MIQPVTVLGAGLCLAMLCLRYRSQPQDRPRRTAKQKLNTAKILAGALLAWWTLSYTLKHTIGQIDGNDHEPSLVERVVFFLAR